MAKTREITCENYIYEHKCKLGRNAIFYGYCQKCPDYKAKKGGQPNRKDNRFKILNRILKKENENY